MNTFRLFLAALTVASALSGCSKSNNGGPSTPSTTSLVYVNNTYTPISISINGASSTIAVGDSLTCTGKPGTPNTGSALTSGITTTNQTVGTVITWDIADVFPTSGKTSESLDVSPQYFFLKVNNTSSYNVTGVYVNYGLVAQTLDNVSFGSGLYNIGYYPAYTNSNVRCISNTGGYWQANTGLPNVKNQYFTFTLTN